MAPKNSMTTKLDIVLQALAASNRPEWESIVKDFFESKASAKDTVLKDRMLDYLKDNVSLLDEISGMTEWKPPFRMPQLTYLRHPPNEPYTIEFAKWLAINPTELRQDRVFEVGCGTGFPFLQMRAQLGIDVVAAELDPICQATTTLTAALHNMVIDLRKTDVDAANDEFTAVFFGNCFYEKVWSLKNLEYARALRKKGKRVIISSYTIWDGSNEFSKLKEGEAKLLYELTYDYNHLPLFELV